MYLLCLSAKATFKIMNLGRHVFRIGFFFKILNNYKKIQTKLYSKLNNCFGTGRENKN